MSAELLMKVIPLVLGLAGLWFGLWQYRAAQTWKRLEFAAGIIEKTNSDPDLRLAITFLDWRQRDAPIPDRFVGVEGKREILRHTHAAMASAFDLQNRERVPETDDLDLKVSELTLDRIVYVDVFDRLFQYLEQVDSFVDIGLVRSKDVLPLSYWADRVCRMSIGGRKVFQDYLAHYQYSGVLCLADRYRRDSRTLLGGDVDSLPAHTADLSGRRRNANADHTS